jgi:2Fe-2S ferredoxin
MPRIIFIEHDGTEHVTGAEVGQSVMQVATANLIPGIIGDCGGYCNCATCHAYVDAQWEKAAGAPASNEAELLECSLDTQSNSRLTCQIRITPEMDGLVIRLPKSQY